jgi:hypothetical protein
LDCISYHKPLAPYGKIPKSTAQKKFYSSSGFVPFESYHTFQGPWYRSNHSWFYIFYIFADFVYRFPKINGNTMILI